MQNDWAVARLTAFGELGEVELGKLKALVGQPQRLRRGAVIRQEGDPHPKLYLLHSGWTASAIAVADGGRQLIKVHLPGDLLGLPGLALQQANDTLFALCPAVISAVEPEAIGRLFEASPRLSAILFLISQEERVRLMDRLASVGRTNAISRLAELILQLHARVLRHDPKAGDSFYSPLLQDHIADLTGLSKVHVNRSLKQLRLDAIVRWSGRMVTILDAPRLNRLAEIASRRLSRDPGWLPGNLPGEG